MQIQKTNMINFGQVKYEYERPSMRKTSNQNEALEQIETELFLSGLEKTLEDKKGADLIIKFRLNGGIDMFVKKELSAAPLQKPKFYVPFTRDGREKLSEEFNLKASNSKRIFTKKLQDFIKKCENYVSAPNCAKNRRIETKANIETEIILDKLVKEGKLDSAIALAIAEAE